MTAPVRETLRLGHGRQRRQPSSGQLCCLGCLHSVGAQLELLTPHAPHQGLLPQHRLRGATAKRSRHCFQAAKLDASDVAPDAPKDVDETAALEKVPRVLETQDLHQHVHVLREAHLWLNDAEVSQHVG